MDLRRSAMALAAVLALALFVPAANATIQLRLNDGNGNTLDILDESADDDCGGIINCVAYIGPLGSWTLNVTTGTSKDALSAPLLIDLLSVNTHAAGVNSTLTIALSDNGFTPASNGFNFGIGGTLGPGGTLTAAAYGGSTNTKFDTSSQFGSTLTFTAPSGPVLAFSNGTGGA